MRGTKVKKENFYWMGGKSIKYNGNRTDKKEYRGIIMKDKEGVIKRNIERREVSRCKDDNKKNPGARGNDITKEKQGR